MQEFTDIELENEIWKDVPGYVGFYQVSDLGRVRSLDRVVHKKNGAAVLHKGQLLKRAIGSTGYYLVSLCKNSVCKSKKVHKLVANVILGIKSNGYKALINHIDENPLNNRSSNLEKETNRGNITKSVRTRGKASPFVGVSPSSSRNRPGSLYNPCWRAGIQVLGRHLHLGQEPFTQEGEVKCSNLYQKALGKLLSDEQYYEDNIHTLPNKEKIKYLLT